MKSFSGNSSGSVNIDALKQQLKSLSLQEQALLEETSAGVIQDASDKIQQESEAASLTIQQNQSQATFNIEQFSQNKIDQIHIFSTIQVQELEQTVQTGQEQIQESVDQAAQVNTQLVQTIQDAQVQEQQLQLAGQAEVFRIQQQSLQAVSSVQAEAADSTNQLTHHKQTLETELQSLKDLLAQQLQDQYDQYQFQVQQSQSSLMVGAVIYTSNIAQFTQDTNKWLLCDGTQFDPVQYSTLFEFLGINTVPNLTSQFIRCQDGTRTPFQVQQDQLKQHSHLVNLNTDSSGEHAHLIPGQIIESTTEIDGDHRHRQYYKNSNSGERGLAEEANNGTTANDDGYYYTNYAGAHRHTFTLTIPEQPSAAEGLHTHFVQGSTELSGDTETRPTNACLYAIIKVDNS